MYDDLEAVTCADLQTRTEHATREETDQAKHDDKQRTHEEPYDWTDNQSES